MELKAIEKLINAVDVWIEVGVFENTVFSPETKEVKKELETVKSLLFGVGSSVKVKIDEPFEIEETNEKYVCELNNFIDKDGCWCIETVIAKVD